MADIDNLSIRISANTRTATNNINNLTEALGRLNQALGAIDPNVLNVVAQTASSMGNMTRNAEGCERAMRTLGEQMTHLQQAGGGVAQVADTAEQLSAATQDAAQGANNAASATRELGSAGQQGASGIQQVASAARNVSRNASESASNIRHLARSTKEASKHASIFAKELTRVGKMMKLMITRMILRKVIQGVLDGFKNLAQYSSTFDASISLLWNSFRQLGNSIAAAVSPLINAFAPALNYIIQLVIKAVNVINQLISALTGMGTWTRAKTLTDDYAKSLDKSNKSAKALKKTVLGFDELNQLQDNNSGGGGETSPADMFEQVPIDPKILNFVDNLKKKIGELKKYWDAFIKGFKRGLGDDWKDKVDLIKDGAGRIKDAIKDIWNDPEVSKSRDEFYTSVSEMLGTVAGTATRVGLNIGANIAQGVADSVEEKSPEIKEHLTEMFNIGTHMADQVSEFSVAMGEISDVLVGDNAIAATKGFTSLFTESFMLIQENAARTGDAVLTLLTQPIIDNKGAISEALDGMFGALATFADFAQGVVKDLRDTLSDVWEAHLSPMFDSLTQGLSDLTGALTEAWNNNIAPVLQEAMDTLKPLWDEYIKPIADNVLHIVGLIGNLVAKLFQSVLVPCLKALIDKWFPRIQDGISIVISAVKYAVQVISLVIEHITWMLRSLLQFFETGFTKGWSQACEEFDKSWSEHWDNMFKKVTDIANSVVEVVEKMINALAHGINAIGDKIGDKLKNLSFPSWLGGGTFNLSIPHLDDVSLPRFRNGGFPKENGLFMANSTELVGEFSNGKTAVANNEQITNGIAQAVFSAITSANASGGNNRYINNTIMVDGVAIARAVTKGQETLDRRYSPSMA